MKCLLAIARDSMCVISQYDFIYLKVRIPRGTPLVGIGGVTPKSGTRVTLGLQTYIMHASYVWNWDPVLYASHFSEC